MSLFLRLLSEADKAAALREVCGRYRAGEAGQRPVVSDQQTLISGRRTANGDPRIYRVAPEAFAALPGRPFAYWVSEAVRDTFRRLPAFEGEGRTARRGPSTCDDSRYLRLWWEISNCRHGIGEWRAFSKGGAFSPFFADIYLLVDWEPRRCTFLGFFGRPGREIERPESVDCFFRPGLTWPLRTQVGLSLRAMPAGGIFGHKGPAAFVANDDPDALLALLALTNSRAFGLLVSLQMAFGSYEVGVIQKTPVPDLSAEHQATLAALARRAWSLKRTLDTREETSHAFLLPAALRHRLGDYDPPAIEAELARLQAEIDAIAFDLYGFSPADRTAAQPSQGGATPGEPASSAAADDQDEEDQAAPIDQSAGLLSWAVGVAFGRFDWRLATGERAAPPEPEPFDPLPAKSPGMLPDGAAPFHAHAGILVDDPGHPQDLARLVEGVLETVFTAGWLETGEASASTTRHPGASDPRSLLTDTRRRLQREFFAFHLQRYSKSRRKAPLYWPLSTAAGGYTLWFYYPSLTNQTLYTAVNDFVEPKLSQVGAEVTALRTQGTARTRDDEKRFEALQALHLELSELRDTLLQLAPGYQPHHDDGVQISAAPLWPLFRHKPWQKVLKDTWAKLEKGDYDWAHLAMAYWPVRVRRKCQTDKSLAIAHGLEHLYIEPEAQPKRVSSRKAI
jgi:hypothetical protein